MKDTIKLNYANGILTIDCFTESLNFFRLRNSDKLVQTPFFNLRSGSLSFCEYSNDVAIFKGERGKVYTLKFKVEDFIFAFEHEEADFSLTTDKTYKVYNLKVNEPFKDEIILN